MSLVRKLETQIMKNEIYWLFSFSDGSQYRVNEKVIVRLISLDLMAKDGNVEYKDISNQVWNWSDEERIKYFGFYLQFKSLDSDAIQLNRENLPCINHDFEVKSGTCKIEIYTGAEIEEKYISKLKAV